MSSWIAQIDVLPRIQFGSIGLLIVNGEFVRVYEFYLIHLSTNAYLSRTTTA